MHLSLSRYATPLVAMVAAHPIAMAAPITWTVHDITGKISDISTSGTLVDARAGANYGTRNEVDGTSFHVNGVLFTDGLTLDTPSHNDTINTRAGAGLDPEYYELLRMSDRRNDGDASITFHGLTVGHQYQIQIWVSENSKTLHDEGIVLNDGTETPPTHGTPGHATLLMEVFEGGPGQYALGTFTADGTSQSFKTRLWRNLTSTPSAGFATFINAVQLRDLGKDGEHATQAGPATANAPNANALHQIVQLNSTETVMILRFNQPLNRTSATNPDNYTISLKGGGTGWFSNASLSEDGHTVTLTYGFPIVIDGSTYIIEHANLTSADGKPLAGKAIEFQP